MSLESSETIQKGNAQKGNTVDCAKSKVSTLVKTLRKKAKDTSHTGRQILANTQLIKDVSPKRQRTQARLLKLGRGLKGHQTKEGSWRVYRMMPSTEGLRNTV